tara:strand:+ start:115 stop:378 length:264 start_codon:yes stop_codon:yes gene_type:complete
MSRIRIISYLPNPRIYKATIVERYSGAEIEVLGDALSKLGCEALLPRLAEYGALYAHVERLLAIKAFRQDLAPYAKFMGFDGHAAAA